MNKSVIMMWKAAQKGWKPSTKVTTERQFKKMKYDGKSSARKGFVGHHYGYMGKYFQPFDNRVTKERLKKTGTKISTIATKKLKKVGFISGTYAKFSKLKDYVIYCDPPYQCHANYYDENGKMIPKFDHEKFWDWCRIMAENNIVFVSEYKMPNDFEKILSIKSRTAGNSKIDKLYLI